MNPTSATPNESAMNGSSNSNPSQAVINVEDNNNNNQSDNNNKPTTKKSLDTAVQQTANQPNNNSSNNEISLSPKLDALKGTCRSAVAFLKYYSALFNAILVPVFCWAPYLSALYHRQTEPLFPMVSDVGSQIPQAPFFSTFLDMFAVFAVFAIYQRYQDVSRHQIPRLQANLKPSDTKLVDQLHRYNLYSLITAVIVAIGVCLIGNFRSSEALIGHIVGVGPTFFGAMFLMLLTLMVTYRLSQHQLESFPLSMIVIAIIGLISLFGCFLFEFMSAIPLKLSEMTNVEFRLRWNSNQPGYIAHTLGSIFEWIAINSIALFFCCLFNRARINRSRIQSSTPTPASANNNNNTTIQV